MVWYPLRGRRSASVYGRGETYVVASARRFGYGPTFRSPPYLVLSRAVSDEELGAAVAAAIDSFTLMAEEPSDEMHDLATAELLVLVGVKTETAFDRGASFVHVHERKRRWSVEPWDRVHGGWLPLRDELTVKLSSPSASELGAAVRQAFVTLRGRP